MHQCLDAMGFQLRFIADATEHEQLGRVDATRTQDHLGLRPDASRATAVANLDARGTGPAERESIHMCAHQQGHVLLRKHGIEVGARHALALTVLDDLVHQREPAAALLPRSVQVFQHRHAQAAASLQHRNGHGMRIVCWLAPHRSTLASIASTWRALPVLHAPVDAQRMLIAPG
ncbi:hypothetical protein D9M68_860430 [compost metagenome]